jgi:pyruvate dehydrogenase E2 component (dihydrolipoamide acetyltransferase)
MTDERIVAVTMPKWGLSMQLGKITGWIVAEGDDVSVGDELADIETEKIAGTLEAADAGTLRRIIARVGEDVPVSSTIALIAPPDVSDDDLDAVTAEARAVIDAGVPADADGGPAIETADIGGRRICYVGTGQDGGVVLLVHGYGGDRNSWLFLQEPLAARHRVYALDLPGHGTSSKDVGDGSVGTLADAVLGVLDAIGAKSAHLIGHSLGGAVAVAAAARDPRRISSLTLIAPSGFGPEINAGYLRGFADAQTRRELKPVVGQLFADESLVTRQVVDDLLAYKRLDGSRRLCAPSWTLSWTASRSASTPPQPWRRSAVPCRSRWSGAARTGSSPPRRPGLWPARSATCSTAPGTCRTWSAQRRSRLPSRRPSPGQVEQAGRDIPRAPGTPAGMRIT